MLKTIKSTRFTLVIILTLIFLYFLGLVVPQRALFSGIKQYQEWQNESVLHALLATLKVTEIYTSPLTMTVLGAFFLNLTVVVIDRTPAVLRKAHMAGGPPKVDPERIRGSAVRSFLCAAPTEIVRARIEKFLLRRKWYVVPGSSADPLLAVRNRFSPLGFLLFHCSFFLCMIGGLLIAYTRFTGQVGVGEGETIHGRMDRVGIVNRVPTLFRTLPEISLDVEKINVRYEEGASSDLDIGLHAVIDGNPRTAHVKINEPLKQGAVSLVALNVGLAPMVVVTDLSGKVVDTLFAKLDVLRGRGDSFVLGRDNQYTVTVRYFPDYAVYNGAETTKSPEPNNPAFHLVIANRGRVVYDGTVRLGEPADFEGFRLSFRELRYWAQFQMIREYGSIPLVFGFVLASIGLIMRLIFYQKRVQILVEEQDGMSVVYVAGQTEYFPRSFSAELTTLESNLRAEVLQEATNA